MGKARTRFDVQIVWGDGCTSRVQSRSDVHLTPEDVATELQAIITRIKKSLHPSPDARGRGADVKVLFLDVDGVLNSLSWFAAQPAMSPCQIDPKAVARIKRVLTVTGAVVVLSSSWRHHDELVARIEAAGIPVYDRTPEIRNQPRAAEIQEWLLTHEERIRSFAIIDDDADAGENFKPQFVRTYPKHGMYGKHERALIAILGEVPTPRPRDGREG